MTEDDLYQMLDERGVPYEVYHHKAIFTVAEGDAVGIPELGAHTKNLFLRDDKKRNYYLVTAHEDQRVDLKALAARIPSRRLSFASEKDLVSMLGLVAGSVTPWGVLNDEGRTVTMIYDRNLKGRRIDAHPLVNTATMFVQMADLVTLQREHGTRVLFLDLGPDDAEEAGPRAGR